jgi:DNA-directed RNA polymerase subunit M
MKFRNKKTKKVKRTNKRAGKKAEKRQDSASKAQIEFCPKCSSIMIPMCKGKTTFLKCRGCGNKHKASIRGMKIIETREKKKGVTVLEKDIVPLPLMEKMCPKCEHTRSHWWLQQTRSADEPPTQFFRCEKCKHTWREYK